MILGWEEKMIAWQLAMLEQELDVALSQKYKNKKTF